MTGTQSTSHDRNWCIPISRVFETRIFLSSNFKKMRKYRFYWWSYFVYLFMIEVLNDFIIIITSHRLITRWGRLRLLLESPCSQFLSSFSFYRRRYLHPFPSNILTNDVFSMVRMNHSRQLSRWWLVQCHSMDGDTEVWTQYLVDTCRTT